MTLAMPKNPLRLSPLSLSDKLFVCTIPKSKMIADKLDVIWAGLAGSPYFASPVCALFNQDLGMVVLSVCANYHDVRRRQSL
jgi:hypothetical protein